MLTMKVVMTSELIFHEKRFGGASTVTNGRPSTSRCDERGEMRKSRLIQGQLVAMQHKSYRFDVQ